MLQLSGLGCWPRSFASVNKSLSEMRAIVYFLFCPIAHRSYFLIRADFLASA